jgi:hypothetical protein
VSSTRPVTTGGTRAGLAVTLCTAAGLVATACGGPTGPASSGRATTTQPPKVVPLPLATVRKRFLAIVGPSDAAFAKFSKRLAVLSPGTTSAEVQAFVAPAAAAVARSGRQLYALRRSASSGVAKDMYTVALDDNTVWQGLEDLESNWGSRSFDFSSWQGAFVQAATTANASGRSLRKALGLPVNGS